MSGSALWRLRVYVRPYRGQMVAMVFAAMAGLGAQIVVPLVTKAVIDGPVTHHDRHALVPLVGLVLALGVFDCCIAFVRRWIQASAANGIEQTIRDDLYAHLQRLPVAFHDQWQSGQLLSRAMSDLSTIRRFLGFGLVFLVVNVATFAVVIGLLFRLQTQLAVLTAASVIPIGWLCFRFERAYIEVARVRQDQEGDLTTVVEEAATGIRVIKAFGRAELAEEQFADRARALRGSGLRSAYLKARFWALLDLVPSLTLGAVLVGGALAVERGSLTVGGLVAFVTLLLMLVWPVEALGWILATGQEAETAARRVYEVLDTEPTVRDRPRARAVDRVVGRVRFEAVGFRYATGGPVLRDVELELAPGETVAVVGATGSGKTTLTALLPRLYDVSAGRVTLDGVDVRDFTLSSLRRHIGVAFEDPILFSASVRENLLLGQADASDADLERALDTAQARFVYDLPWGLDTRVGEQGLTLSGGQRQRLALARAIVGDPAVLVLDDPLSALDVHTEALVEEALARVLGDTTALVVVHRPSTVALADRVAFLADGRIVATGAHADLLERVPAYRAVLAQEAEPSSLKEAG
ncbi:MAG: ATP-binding cassette, subfamily bacterial [Actinomycetota bacterium]|nr:ATP-binding cassette, subfamily bacterial [Actinomycetota bacterium]